MSLSPLTPYAAAKVANVVLANKGMDKTITPQMMYSYAKNDRIETVEVPGTKKVHFDGDAFKAWLESYIAGNAASGRTDFDKLATQYMTSTEVDESETDRQMEAEVAEAE